MTGSASRWWTLLAFVVLSVVTTSLAAAQGTTASLSGIISDDHGALPGATIVAKDTQSGFTYEAVSDEQGAFNLSGLRPGTYEITVSMVQYKPQSKTVQVLLGQSLTSNFKIGPDVMYAESVEVVGSSRLIETRTSEVSTSVTPEQVRYLPQNQRNFLNFASLAPGARVSDDETRKQVTCLRVSSSDTRAPGARGQNSRSCASRNMPHLLRRDAGGNLRHAHLESITTIRTSTDSA